MLDPNSNKKKSSKSRQEQRNSPIKIKKRATKLSETSKLKTDKAFKAKSTLIGDVMFKNLALNEDIKRILIKDAFRMFDTDESGFIDKKEFRKLVQSLGIEMNVKKIDDLMRSVDKDGSGSIDIDEFTNMMLNFQFNEESAISTHLESAFSLYDKDDDGVISEEDLLKVAIELDEEIKQDEALMIINLAKTLMMELNEQNNKIKDDNNDSDVVGITKEEFVNLLLGTKFLNDKEKNFTKDNKMFASDNENGIKNNKLIGSNGIGNVQTNDEIFKKQATNVSNKNTSKESIDDKNNDSNSNARKKKSSDGNKSDGSAYSNN